MWGAELSNYNLHFSSTLGALEFLRLKVTFSASPSSPKGRKTGWCPTVRSFRMSVLCAWQTFSKRIQRDFLAVSVPSWSLSQILPLKFPWKSIRPTAGRVKSRRPTWDAGWKEWFDQRSLETVGWGPEFGDEIATWAKKICKLHQASKSRSNCQRQHTSWYPSVGTGIHCRPRKFIGLENVGHLLSINMRDVFEGICKDSCLCFIMFS